MDLRKWLVINWAVVAELADALDSKSGSLNGSVGSTPSVGTKPSLLAAGEALHWHHAFPHSHGCSVRDGSARFGSVPPSQTGALLGAVRDQNGPHLLLEELVVHRFGGARERCEESEREGLDTTSHGEKAYYM